MCIRDRSTADARSGLTQTAARDAVPSRWASGSPRLAWFLGMLPHWGVPPWWQGHARFARRR
eukprot:6806197-Alexandrium_andersonii.AAC.1